MIESKYIYDLSEAKMRSMNTMSYPDALLYQLEAAKRLSTRLISGNTFMNMDYYRIAKINKAIKHNTLKLKEIGYFDKQPSPPGALKIHPNQSSIDDFLKD